MMLALVFRATHPLLVVYPEGNLGQPEYRAVTRSIGKMRRPSFAVFQTIRTFLLSISGTG
jgi:hypothetical protein